MKFNLKTLLKRKYELEQQDEELKSDIREICNKYCSLDERIRNISIKTYDHNEYIRTEFVITINGWRVSTKLFEDLDNYFGVEGELNFWREKRLIEIEYNVKQEVK